MSKIAPNQLAIGAWLLSAVVTLTALIAWWTMYNGRIVSTYQLFPLFGLLAFSLMWAHYMVAVAKMHTKADKNELKAYFEITSLVVLVAILLHPGLLIWQLWHDGFGLPPNSYLEFYGEGAKLAILAGTVSWAAFIAYEFRRKFKEKSWWKYVQYASDGAMILIFLHALRLGDHLQAGWFRFVWFFYGVTLVMALLYMYDDKLRKLLKR